MEDLIKRADAIKAVWKPQVKPNELIFDALKTAIESEINNVPSTDRPQGEWLDTGKDPSHSHPLTAIWYRCSECGDGTNTKTNYCPECGAKMKQ